jgi:hypothetical protein
MKNALFFFSAAISIALTSTTSEAFLVPPQLGASASPPIVLAANGCGRGRYRGPYGSCHRFGRGPYPGGYYGRYVHRFCWYGGDGALHCTRP